MKYLKIITTISILITLTLSTLATQAQSITFEYDAAGNMIKRTSDIDCYLNRTILANGRNDTKLDRLYISSGKIETQQLFSPGIDVLVRENELVEFKADHIELKPGFKVESNGCFNAIIDPCD